MNGKRTIEPPLWRSFLPAITLMIVIFILSAMPADESSMLSEYAGFKIFTVANDVLGLGWTQRMIGQMSQEAENFLRKLAHFTEYLFLAVSLRHGFIRLLQRRGIIGETRTADGQAGGAAGWQKEQFLPGGIALLCSVLYAASDEFHQSFVPGRSCMLRDVGIDSVGAAVGILLCLLVAWIKRRKNGQGKTEA